MTSSSVFEVLRSKLFSLHHPTTVRDESHHDKLDAPTQWWHCLGRCWHCYMCTEEGLAHSPEGHQCWGWGLWKGEGRLGFSRSDGISDSVKGQAWGNPCGSASFEDSRPSAVLHFPFLQAVLDGVMPLPRMALAFFVPFQGVFIHPRPLARVPLDVIIYSDKDVDVGEHR